MSESRDPDPEQLFKEFQDLEREAARRQEAQGRQIDYEALSLTGKFARAIRAPGNSSKELGKLSTKVCELDLEEKLALKGSLVNELGNSAQEELDTLIET
jgi:hypothetical protein